MGVCHITYTSELKEICLYLDGGCNFSCHGCISKYHPEDCHLDETPRQTKNKTLSQEEVISYLDSFSFKRLIFLGWEPTQDRDFLPLARISKERFSTYNIFLTNGYEFIEDKAIDEVCVSIKAISKELFKDFTGKDNPEQVLENFKGYVNSHLLVRAESVFIPSYLDERNIEKIACFISKVDKTIPYRIDAYIPFNNDKFRRPTEAEMNKAKIIAEKYLGNVYILHKGVRIRYPVKRIY